MRGIRIHERIRLARLNGSAPHTTPAARSKAARTRLTAVRVRAACSRTERQQSMPARQKDRGKDLTLLRWVLLLLRTFTSVTGSGTPVIQSSFRRPAEIGPGATCARCFGLSENCPQLANDLMSLGHVRGKLWRIPRKHLWRPHDQRDPPKPVRACCKTSVAFS